MPPVADTESHELTKIDAAKPYGCSNQPRKETYLAQDGWYVDGGRHMVTHDDTMSKLCRYDKRPTDPRCGECKLQSDTEYLESYGK